MSQLIATGGSCMCTFGTAPGTLTSTNNTTVLVEGKPAMVMTDSAAMVNITPFGLCKSPLNPSTAALTAAAFGVLTPGPCIPTPAGIWIPTKPNVICMTSPVLVNNSFLPCAFGGIIKVNIPGQFKVMA